MSIGPILPPHLRRTYALRFPKATHFRPATCEEAGCAMHQNGWESLIDERTDLGRRQAWYIRSESGRAFAEERTAEGLTRFTFEPGQRCFTRHQVRLEREPLFLLREGDSRGNPRGAGGRKFGRGADWVDHFAEHQQTLADRQARG